MESTAPAFKRHFEKIIKVNLQKKKKKKKIIFIIKFFLFFFN